MIAGVIVPWDIIGFGYGIEAKISALAAHHMQSCSISTLCFGYGHPPSAAACLIPATGCAAGCDLIEGRQPLQVKWITA